MHYDAYYHIYQTIPISDETTVRHIIVYIEHLPFLNAVSRSEELKRNPDVHIDGEEKVEIIEYF